MFQKMKKRFNIQLRLGNWLSRGTVIINKCTSYSKLTELNDYKVFGQSIFFLLAVRRTMDICIWFKTYKQL